MTSQKFSSEGNESSQYDIYPLESRKIQEKSLFIPEIVKTSFLAQNYTPSAFPWFSRESEKFLCSIFRNVSFQKQLQQPPGELILLKLCQNVANIQKLNVIMFGGARLIHFTVMVNNLMVWPKSPPSFP